MAGKKLVALTNIKHSDGFIDAGDEFDASTFSKEELQSLWDSGAVEVREGKASVTSVEPESAPAEAAEPAKAEPAKGPVTTPTSPAKK